MSAYFYSAVVVSLLVFFERELRKGYRALVKARSHLLKNDLSGELAEDSSFNTDLFNEISFGSLYEYLVRYKKER